MSEIVKYRDDVINAIRAGNDELKQVDWYDAIFDETDIEEWLIEAPCAFVAVRNISSSMNSTGELNLNMDMLITVITQDQYSPRDADEQLWKHLENIAYIVNYNKFGNVNAALTTQLKLTRLRDPALRRDGIAFGIIEWAAGLTIGKDYTTDIFYYDEDGTLITSVPQNVTIEAVIRSPDDSTFQEETINTGESAP